MLGELGGLGFRVLKRTMSRFFFARVRRAPIHAKHVILNCYGTPKMVSLIVGDPHSGSTAFSTSLGSEELTSIPHSPCRYV